MITILGAGGPFGTELAKILTANKKPLRLVSRTPKPLPGAEVRAADLADQRQTIRLGHRILYKRARATHSLE